MSLPDDTPVALADYLAQHYAALKSKITRLLGNRELADDALQDTWLRVNSRGDADGPVHSPTGYLLRMAVNIAVDIRRRQARAVPFDEIQELMELADPAPGPAQVVEERARMEALGRQIERLPERQRLVVLAVHWEGLAQKDIAARLGVSLRTVESDLKKAHDTLVLRRDR